MLPQSLGLQSAINGHLQAINCTLTNSVLIACIAKRVSRINTP